MKTLSRVETAAIAAISVAGAGVLASSMLANSLNITAEETKPTEHNSNGLDMEIRLPKMPESKEELYQAWAKGYVQVKPILKKLFHLAGVTFLAPIFASAVDDAYAKWQSMESCPCSLKNTATK